ncbi:hypothetical protein QOT17_008277 [Balamuthia mandrillaris]
MEGPKNQKWKRSRKPFSFQFETRLEEKDPSLSMECEHEVSKELWSGVLRSSEATQSSQGLCDEVQGFAMLLKDAFDNFEGSSMEVVRDTTEEHDNMILQLSHKTRYSTKTFTVILRKVKQDPYQRLERIVLEHSERLNQLKHQQPFCFNPQHCSSQLKLSCDSTVVAMANNSRWDTVYSAESFTTGVHYFMVRCLRSVSAHIMVGVAPSNFATIEAQFVGQQNGRSFYLTNGVLYNNGATTNTGAGNALATPGALVAVQLDLNNNQVTWFYNGVEVGQLNIDPGEYFFAVSLYNKFDAVKVVSKHCWSREE